MGSAQSALSVSRAARSCYRKDDELLLRLRSSVRTASQEPHTFFKKLYKHTRFILSIHSMLRARSYVLPVLRLPLLPARPARELCISADSWTPSSAAASRLFSAAGRRRLSSSPQLLTAAGDGSGSGAGAGAGGTASSPPSAAAPASTAAAAAAQDGVLMSSSRKVRNLAVLAHVDHGKTSLVSFLILAEDWEKAQRLVPHPRPSSGPVLPPRSHHCRSTLCCGTATLRTARARAWTRTLWSASVRRSCSACAVDRRVRRRRN